MRIEQTSTTSVPGHVVTECIRRYFLTSGYRQLASDGGALIYRRGSLFGTFLSLSPKGWECTVTVKTMPLNDDINITAVMDVNATGQIVTGKERHFWESELGGLKAAIEADTLSDSPNAQAVHNALWQNIYFVIAFGGIVLLAGQAAKNMGASLPASIMAVLLGAVITVLITARVMRFSTGASREIRRVDSVNVIPEETKRDASYIETESHRQQATRLSESVEEQKQNVIRH